MNAPVRDVPVGEAPGVVCFPQFGPPGFLTGRPATPGIEVQGVSAYTTTADAVARQRALEASGFAGALAYTEFEPAAFARVLAKIAHAFVAANAGLDSFRPLLPPVILGKDPNVSFYVGGTPIDGPVAVQKLTSRRLAHDRAPLAMPLGIDEGLGGGKMAHPIQMILMRQLAGYLSIPLFLVDPKGSLLFYNEPAEALLGRRFDETGAMPADEWSSAFIPVDEVGQPIPPNSLPLMITLTKRRPAYRRFFIRSLDGALRHVEVASIPIAGLHGDFLGAAALFWEVTE